jgi:RNase P subunit RPR2
VLEVKSKGVHAHVNCETCHGPLAKHADDPGSVVPVRPEVATLCVRCHMENIAKPAGFPQVHAKEHAQGQSCKECHQPHSPGFETRAKSDAESASDSVAFASRSGGVGLRCCGNSRRIAQL